jgi:hypothetical protein
MIHSYSVEIGGFWPVADNRIPLVCRQIAESIAFDLKFRRWVWLVFFRGPPATQSRRILTPFTAPTHETAKPRERDYFHVRRKYVLYRAKIGSNCVILLTIEANFLVPDRVSRIVGIKLPNLIANTIHYGSQRKTYPSPRTVWMSLRSNGSSTLVSIGLQNCTPNNNPGSQTPDVNIDDVAIPLERHVPDLRCDQRSRISE